MKSSAPQQELDELRSVLDADDAVAAVTSSSDAGTGKPAPDLVQAALERGELASDRAVFVGDAAWDGESCRRAGVTFVGVTCGGTPEAVLRDAGAVEVWRDPQDLLDPLGDSVLGRLAR